MELKIHVPDIDIHLDPQKMDDMYSMMINLQLYRGLLRYNINGDVMADLAESWTISPNKLSYKFILKKASFSDGSPITAKNVQMTFARLFSVGSSMAADIDYIVGANEFEKTKDLSKLGIKVLAPNEIEFRLSHPSAIFLKQLAVADCSILPVKNFRDEKLNNLSFSGPYKLTYSTETEFTVEKWRADPFDSQRPPQKISFFKSKEIPEKLAFGEKTDSLDNTVVSESTNAELRSKGWSGNSSQLTWEVFVILNPKYVPIELRRELYQKTNSNDLVKFFGAKEFVPAYGLIPNGFEGTLSEKDVSDNVKDHAPYSGKKISFKLDYIENSPTELRLAQWLKGKWDSKNIEVILNPLAPKDKFRRMFGKIAEATIGQKGTDYPDGLSVLTNFKGKYEYNYFHVNDLEIDAMIANSIQELDAKRRVELYKSIQNKILKYYTNIPLYFGSQASGLWSEKVASVPSHPLGVHTMPFEGIEMRAP